MEPIQCAKLLEGGIYTTLNVVKTGDFLYDLKKYYESEKFKEDFKARKFSFGFEAIDPTSMVKNVLNFGASDDEINSFQEKIKSLETIMVSQSFFDSFSLHTPNKDIIEGYLKCLEVQNNKKGLSTVVQEGDEGITIYIFYNKISSTDPSPVVEDYKITNGIEISKSFHKGGILDDDNSITFKRSDPSKDIFFFLDTDKGPVNCLLNGLPNGFNKDFPVGTVLCSYLNWVEFQEVTQNNLSNPDKNWNSKYSKWAPCDGRIIDSTCGLARAGQNLTNVPDLRGVFLRGNNVFDSNEAGNGIPGVSSQQKDPSDNRLRGSIQQDEFKEHNHQIVQQSFGGVVATPLAVSGNTSGADGDLDGSQTVSGYDKAAVPLVIAITGGKETRPKNMAINYYIRIN
ncbi:hypothetical protein KYG33_00475 [Chryseobacterium sp. D764]|jgi:hypothetical protein|uniref:hypothetical protein n=1 Tax=unclassified Chryseobacterium TaxID=2593645 RepID=UPI00098707DA|nr:MULTISPECIES: hypothetical protein [unclassified Chryseobacterium]QXU49557.1 hypothetical protein KYG33_00475 [Chryseobacterium sp. D764]CAD0225452.1 conserved protein of unknown function [Chryseobacterium sp. JV274]